MRKKYIDVDRLGNGFILTVIHTVNKKNEPIEIIQTVEHLGPIDHWTIVIDYSGLDIWPRAHESGDWLMMFTI